MPVTYTNRKGRTYYLCRRPTKTGKFRYFFARTPKDEPVQEIPEGWEIRESVNGVVSLSRKRPALIRPEEVAAVDAAVQRHPKSRRYRVGLKGDKVVVYELAGPDMGDLVQALVRQGLGSLDMVDKMRADQEQHGQFTPVLRFTLTDEETRHFVAQRWCYRGSVDDWIYVDDGKSLDKLARRLIPTLGSDRFFDL